MDWISAMQTQSLPRDFTFGRFRVSPSQRLLSVDGKPAKLGARAFDVLLALAERRERIVGKNELLDVVWPGLVVEENNLQVQIWALRKLLGPDVIATIPGRGYRFTGVLEGDRKPMPAQAAEGTAPSAPRARTPTNLPAELPLYGREDDIQAVQRLVHEHRLVTITGAGGIGKTRLGQTVAHALRDSFVQGVWLIELAPLADPALLAASVAQVLGHSLRSTSAPLAELAMLLRSQRLLLVIDNCEHLVEVVSELAELLLGEAPDVHMLVTSQEPLRLPDERLYRLGTLGVPAEGDTVSAGQALEHGAVRLFVERTHALDARFALDERNVQAVIDICGRLDGLALAIEMAAARVPALGVQGVRERLGERLRMLTAGSRIALRRHQTLRAALDWSHGLLEPHDQVVFRRLGVFSGGCTIEAAQQVASDEQIDEWAVLDAIGRLVDKSLIVADGDDRPRYRMLESARAYALEKLAATQETDALARRHASYFAAYAERICDAFFAAGGTEDGFIAARAAEFDNFRAALKWSLSDDGDVAIAVALLGHASPLDWVAASRVECEAWLRSLKQRLAIEELTPKHAALYCAAEISWDFMTAWHSTADVDARGPWSLIRQTLLPLGERWTAYWACLWALVEAWRGRVEAARAVLDEVRQLEQPDWPAWLPALRLSNEIRISRLAGDWWEEVGELTAMLARLQREGDGDGRAAFVIATCLGEDCLRQGLLEEAAQRFLALAEQGRRQRRDSATMVLLFRSLIVSLTELGRLDQAHEVVVEAMTSVRWFALRGFFAPIAAFLAARRGRFDTAARLLAAGEVRTARVGGHRETIRRNAEHKARGLIAAARVSDDQLSAWFREGAALSDEDFDRLMIQET
jgi:predicted ATPase/DNA-binding winged helix-turn-helix (wHTH) protein